MKNTKKIAYLALLSATALMLSYIEALLPAFIAIPGAKIGLANIAVVCTLYLLGAKEAFAVSLVRVILSALLFGNPLSAIYSASGALFSLIIMIIIKKIGAFSPLGVSCAGGIAHNAAQIAVAAVITEAGAIIFYLPYLALFGVLSGIGIGIASAVGIRLVGDRVGAKNL